MSAQYQIELVFCIQERFFLKASLESLSTAYMRIINTMLLKSPLVDVQCVRKRVHTNLQKDKKKMFTNEEYPNDFNNTELKFYFAQFIESVMQITSSTLDGAGQFRLTPKQLFGFVMTFLGMMILVITLSVDKII